MGNITLLMMSDEKDETYRTNIINLAIDYSHVRILDTDNLINKTINEAVQELKLPAKLQNNFFVFEIEQQVLMIKDGIVQFELERRRKNCRNYIPIEERYGNCTDASVAIYDDGNAFHEGDKDGIMHIPLTNIELAVAAKAEVTIHMLSNGTSP